jgi:hypothetical protein
MSEKLPVFATLGEAFRCTRKYSLRMLPYMVAVGVIWIAFIVGAFLVTSTFFVLQKGVLNPSESLHSVMIFIPIFGLLEVGLFAALLPVITSFQRLVLQGSGARVGFAYRREEWLTVGAVVRLIFAYIFGGFCIMVVIALVAALAKAIKAPWVGALVGVPLILFCMMTYLRWILVMPAAAVGERISLKAAYRLTKGNFWRYLAILMLASMLTVIPQMLVLFVIMPTPPVPPDMMTAMQPHIPVFVSIILFAAFLVLYYFGFLMTTAAWALIYGRLSSGTAEPDELSQMEGGALPDPVI